MSIMKKKKCRKVAFISLVLDLQMSCAWILYEVGRIFEFISLVVEILLLCMGVTKLMTNICRNIAFDVIIAFEHNMNLESKQ